MELWVRSQDKEALLKVNNGLMYWDDTDKRNCIVIKETSTNLSVLGTYKTKERALEVLDEIQEYLLKMGENEILTDKIGIMNGIKHYGIVYEMPEE